MSFMNLTVVFVSCNLHTEFDALTGSKLSSVNIGSPVVRMSYSPTSGHAVVAILEVGPLYVITLLGCFDFLKFTFLGDHILDLFFRSHEVLVELQSCVSRYK